jgi:Raf kinase inhibitor-like YbhB/YbcL family protein
MTLPGRIGPFACLVLACAALAATSACTNAPDGANTQPVAGDAPAAVADGATPPPGLDAAAGGAIDGATAQAPAVGPPDAAAIYTSFSKPLPGFQLVSNQVAEGKPIADAQVFDSFGCSGANVSPELAWEGAPVEARSFAVTMYDPDAPTGSGFWHWLVFDIPADTHRLASDAGDTKTQLLPAGARQGSNDFGLPGYAGPCPPPGSGPHRYFVRVHALKVARLDVAPGATAAVIGFYINANTIATTQLMAVYERK